MKFEGKERMDEHSQRTNNHNMTRKNTVSLKLLDKANSKVIRINNFLNLKKHQSTETRTLRHGLVIKLHALREEAIKTLAPRLDPVSLDELRLELLALAEEYIDHILSEDVSTLNLLNRYWQCRGLLEQRIQEIDQLLHS